MQAWLTCRSEIQGLSSLEVILSVGITVPCNSARFLVPQLLEGRLDATLLHPACDEETNQAAITTIRLFQQCDWLRIVTLNCPTCSPCTSPPQSHAPGSTLRSRRASLPPISGDSSGLSDTAGTPFANAVVPWFWWWQDVMPHLPEVRPGDSAARGLLRANVHRQAVPLSLLSLADASRSLFLLQACFGLYRCL